MASRGEQGQRQNQQMNPLSQQPNQAQQQNSGLSVPRRLTLTHTRTHACRARPLPPRLGLAQPKAALWQRLAPSARTQRQRTSLLGSGRVAGQHTPVRTAVSLRPAPRLARGRVQVQRRDLLLQQHHRREHIRAAASQQTRSACVIAWDGALDGTCPPSTSAPAPPDTGRRPPLRSLHRTPAAVDAARSFPRGPCTHTSLLAYSYYVYSKKTWHLATR